MPTPTIVVQSDTTGTTINTLPAVGSATSSNSLPVVIANDQTPVGSDTVIKATSTSRSGTITTGGAAQQFAAANASRRGFVIQNQSSGDLYINSLSAATLDQNSLKIPAGSYYETPVHHVGTGALSIIGATTGQQFYSREF